MRRLLLLLAVGVIAWALVAVPLPLLSVTPGVALSVSSRISLDGAADDLSGDLLLTTVAVERLTAVEAAAAWVDDDAEILFRQQLIPRGMDRAEYERIQRRLFDESARVAGAVGLRAAGETVEISGGGARVEAVVPGGPAAGKLETGDVITAVDGEPIALASDLLAAISATDGGEALELGVRRADERHTVRVDARPSPALERPTLGVTVRTIDLQVSLPVDVDITRGRVAGPSAGLMVALAAYDLVDPGDLTDGRRIAGTGTIRPDGRVGAVGGVDQKVRAARDAGATVFLVAEADADRARQAAGDTLTVVGVRDFDAAHAALRAERP